MRKNIIFTIYGLLVSVIQVYAQDTYAEKLGYPKGSKVLILHVDDIGMSHESNAGAILAMEKGVANSVSMMMPCPWIPEFFHYLREHPKTDAGLHLTLTSEWTSYRWGPLAGKPAVPTLVDHEGVLWSSVAEVVSHARADEIEAEIRAQLDRARSMGWQPTHLDSHMGTLFATPEYLLRYIKVGIENKIPVMFPGGHNTMIAKSQNATPIVIAQMQETGKSLWNSGLPVLDDLHNSSYGFNYPKGSDDATLQKLAAAQYIESIKSLKPGLTMVIMHCSEAGTHFNHISDSGTLRKADLLAMMSPELKKFLETEKIILTTWREVMERRQQVK